MKKFKFRRRLTRIGFVLIALVAISAIFAKLTVPPAAAAWFDDTFAYRQTVTFTHNAAITSERRVVITIDTTGLVTNSKIQSTCADARFTDANGKPLRYQLTSACNLASTTFDVVFLTINNGSNLAYFYYGNPAAISGSTTVSDVTALTPSGAPSVATETQGPSPVSYWNFDEAQGTTANDYSTGSNNDLTITNAAWKTTDLCIFGNCLYFDGSTDYATKSYSADTELLPGTGSFTVSAWFKHSSTAGADTLISRADAVAGVGWKVYMDSSGYMCFGIDDTATSFPSDSACTTTSYADSQWHYVTAVKSTTASITVYIDGQQAGQDASLLSTLTLNGTNAPITVGNDFDNGTNGWDGFIDEVKYYNFAKTAAQITAEYASKSVPKGTAASFGTNQAGASLSTGLIAWWKLDEADWGAPNCSTDVVFDSSGNSFSGDACPATTGPTGGETGKFGNGVTFDNSNDYLQVGDNTTLRFDGSTQDFAYFAWIKRASGANDTDDILNKLDLSSDGYEMLIRGTTNGRLQCRINATTQDSTTQILDTNWHHVGCVYDRDGNLTTYVDGVAESNTSISSISLATTANFIIGAGFNGTVGSMNGTIDDIRIYNRALSPAEVSQLYNWAPGPVGWWKLDENTGTAANDSSANGNNGTLGGGTAGYRPTWSSGKAGSALRFDDTDDYINAGAGSSLDITGTAITLEAWINSAASSTTNGIISKSGYANGYRLLVNTSNAINFQVSGDTYSLATPNNSISSNMWYHVAGVYDGTKMYVYINGVRNGTTLDRTGAIETTTNPVWIGMGDYGGCPGNSWCFPFAGIIDDVRVYNYARSQKQIVEDMNAGHPAGGSPIGSQAVYWNFDEGQGTTANNSGTASSSNGTLTSIASPATSTSGWTFTGKINKGIVFDGTDDKVVIATANDAAVDFATTEQFSSSAWVYVTTMPGSANQDAIIAKWDDTGNLAAYKLYVENDDADTTGNFEVQIYDESASQAITASQAIDQVAVNTWYHIAFTFNGGTAGAAGDLKLYVNGQYTAQNAANASFLGLEDLASDFTVGDYDAGDVVANNTAFTGTIDEVKVYSGLLSQSEIQVDMNAGSAAALGGVLGTQDNEGFGGNPPVGWWKMDEGSWTNDCSTDTVFDSSGNGNNGDACPNSTGPTGGVPGKFGNAGLFDGGDDKVTITRNANLESTNFTISMWLNPTSLSNVTFIAKRDTFPNLDWQIWHGATEIRMALGESSGDNVFDNQGITISLGSWHHFAVTKNGNDYKMFIDGVLKASDTSAQTWTESENIHIGGLYPSDTANSFDGKIDDVKIYNYALTQAQIAYLYNRGAPVAQYDFDECQGATAYNAALNANGQAAGMNGTINFGTLGNTAVGDCTTSGSTMWFNGATGKYNSSLDFDGSDDYVQISDNANLDTNLKNLSISFWAKLNTLVNYDFFLAKQTDTSADGSYGFLLNNDTPQKIQFRLWTDLNTNTMNSDGGFPTGTWTHVLGTWNGTLMKLYINGIQQQVGVDRYNIGNNVIDSAYNLIIGASSNPSNYIDAQIDDVRIYNYELTTAQIARLYNEGSAVRFGPQTGSP